MFEILKALLTLSQTAGPQRTHWKIHYEGERAIMRIEIPLSYEEAEFAEDMQAMFAPRDEPAPAAPDPLADLLAEAEAIASDEEQVLLLTEEANDRLEATGRDGDFWSWLAEMRDQGDAGSDEGLLEVWLKQEGYA